MKPTHYQSALLATTLPDEERLRLAKALILAVCRLCPKGALEFIKVVRLGAGLDGLGFG
jgi:hypothetical protein